MTHSSKTIFDPPPIIMEIKTKTNIWDLNKFKSFVKQRRKETINTMERQASEWKKITPNEATKDCIRGSISEKQAIQ